MTEMSLSSMHESKHHESKHHESKHHESTHHESTHGEPAVIDLSRASPEGGQSTVMQSASPDCFERIHDPAVELVIWDRTLPAAIERWLNDLRPDQLPNGRLTVAAAHLAAAVSALLDDASMPRGPMRDAFNDDVIAIVERFMCVMDTDVVDMRLETVSDDSCWKFHRDFVVARMLATYRGPGTQWVQPEDSDAALSEQKAYQGPLEQFSPNAVGLFKGSRAGEGEGIVHRSPPISETGISRLLLCLNLPSRISPSIWQPPAGS